MIDSWDSEFEEKLKLAPHFYLTIFAINNICDAHFTHYTKFEIHTHQSCYTVVVPIEPASCWVAVERVHYKNGTR